MLDFVIFAVTFIVFLIGLIIYLYPTSGRVTTIPGVDPSDPRDGNIPDIAQAGSLHEYLVDLHDGYGKIVSFWMGERMVVSVASPDIFQQHSGVFDRPVELFQVFESLIGPEAVLFSNGLDGRKKRLLYDKTFADLKNSKLISHYNKFANELGTKWSTLINEQHVPLSVHTFALAFKIILRTLLGDCFQDDRELSELRKNFDLCWSHMEHCLKEGKPPEGNDKRFAKARTSLTDLISSIISKRKKSDEKSSDFLGALMESGASNDVICSEVLCCVAYGFHSTGNLLTWLMYFLATHDDIQKKVIDEIMKLNLSNDVTAEDCEKFKYLNQVIKETLRCAAINPWAARVQETDIELGGHVIPKKTPVIQALGVALQDEKIYPQPLKFDPERFSPEQAKSRDPMTFKPFGFAGKRHCPAQNMVFTEAIIVAVNLLRKFKISMVEGQVVTPVYSLVTHPEEEVWILVENRKS